MAYTYITSIVIIRIIIIIIIFPLRVARGRRRVRHADGVLPRRDAYYIELCNYMISIIIICLLSLLCLCLCSYVCVFVFVLLLLLLLSFNVLHITVLLS